MRCRSFCWVAAARRVRARRYAPVVVCASDTPLRFLADAYNVLIMGPVGVGKTFLANALGHIAVRRGHSVHTERADKLFKRLNAARLDGSYEDEMRTVSTSSSSTTSRFIDWRPPRPATSTS